MSGRIVVIGVGNPLRGDDGIGPAVVEALRGRVPGDTVLAVSDGEPGRLLDLWRGADTVVVVESLRTRPARPGALHTLTPAEAAGHHRDAASTHGFGLQDCLVLADALGLLPPRLVVHAVEVADVGLGAPLSEAVRSALPALADRAEASVRRARARNGGPQETGEPGR
ncbi:hydrogenase maturation protease [Streptomyces triticiradicis]|uniref:Hydrogenase maturation protease n=1 Tax=Streptomyces triticiradicis TaxID=2651189 RepID=A0A7J5DNW9_9ACTN|nr:hydrogenase maturation protease [Streptomyces triticiradicis]KAB1990480.1 hydrogenase maturation protease [Streptomyces triticiradicis]